MFVEDSVAFSGVGVGERLEAQACADGMGATKVGSRLIGVVECEAYIVGFGEGHIDGGAGTETVVGGGGVGPKAGLHDVAAAHLEHLHERVFDTDGVVVAQEGIGGESAGDGNALVVARNEKVVGEADIEAGGQLDFGGLLPEDKEQGIYDFASSLSGEIWLAAWAGRSREEVAAKIPEFKTADDTDLAMVLRNMGMKTMFDDGKADFRAMAEYDKANIAVSGVQQKTFLELDRSGTKAAAVTGMTMAAQTAAPLEPKTVYLDRPFVYMIIDGATGLPLFTGVTGEIKD